MTFRSPRDLLVECGACGIENLYSEYTPKMPTVCNQCRERVIWPNFNETHNEYLCGDCGFSIALLKKTEFAEGTTPCRCESLNIHPVSPSKIPDEAEAAGAFNMDDEPVDDSGFDWFRSEPEAGPENSDYNEIFDQDPGNN